MRNKSGVWGWTGRLTCSLLIGQRLGDLRHTRQERNISLSVEIPGIQGSSCSLPGLSVRFLHKTPRGTISDRGMKKTMQCAICVLRLLAAQHLKRCRIKWLVAFHVCVLLCAISEWYRIPIRQLTTKPSHSVVQWYLTVLSVTALGRSACWGIKSEMRAYCLPLFTIASGVKGHY